MALSLANLKAGLKRMKMAANGNKQFLLSKIFAIFDVADATLIAELPDCFVFPTES
jgi:hypothetical protein